MTKPNLLFLWTDQQRADTLAAYGNSRIQMPNLNKLASESTVFDQAYVTQTVCTPSRSTVMTGLYPHSSGCTTNNMPLSPDIPILTEMLDDDDYVTGYHGKWHLGDEIFAQRGFDDWVSVEDMYIKHYGAGRDRGARSSYHHFLVENGFVPKDGSVFGRGESLRLPEAFSKPAFLANEASRFIREHQGQPFALYVNFLEPHSPFFGPRDDQYDPETIDLPPSYAYPPTRDQSFRAQVLQRRWRESGMSGLPLKTDADWRRIIANYWGLNSLVDTHMGRILDTLEACGLAENTIVVYTSDHGDMMGNHRLIAKTVMFEEAMHVPLLVRLPGQRRGRRVRGPVSQIDLVPTLLDLLDAPGPSHLQGKSLKPWLASEGEAVLSEDVVVEWNGSDGGLGGLAGQGALPEWLAEFGAREEAARAMADPVRTIITPDGWKFCYSQLGHHELYNRIADPTEVRNLAVEAGHKPLMRQLAERIVRWQERTNDTVPILPESI